MKLTPKMMSNLYKEFDKDPRTYLGMTLDYQDDTMVWTVADQVLTTAIGSTPGDNLTLDLTAYTLTSLVAAINAHAHYTAVLEAPDGTIGAIALMDSTGHPGNGIDQNELLAFSDITWATVDAAAHEVTDIRTALVAVLNELRIDMADTQWLDYWLDFILGTLRQDSDTDTTVRSRIMTAMTLVKCNNVALEKIVLSETGLSVQVVDIDWYDGNQAMFTYGGTLWDSSMVTNSADSRIYPAWSVKADIVADYGLLPGTDGVPSYGDPRKSNPLVCAFAVIFAATPTCTQYKAVMAAINKNRDGGTLPLAYQPSSPMLTNTVGHNTNSTAHLSGPIGTLYALFTC